MNDTDLDRRTLLAMRERDPSLREIPEDRLKKTFAFAHARLRLAVRDLGRATIQASGIERLLDWLSGKAER